MLQYYNTIISPLYVYIHIHIHIHIDTYWDSYQSILAVMIIGLIMGDAWDLPYRYMVFT